MIDLDAYLHRIGYDGPRTPTLQTLRAIHVRHPDAMPFENLDPLLRRPVRLDAASLEQKLVRDGRGGYCYEHNLLLGHALTALGFPVTFLAARVLLNAPEGVIRPRSHAALLVDLDGRRYVADVGFGGQTLTAPLLLEPDVEQATPHGPFRLLCAGDEFVMQSKIKGEWTALYRFDLQPQQVPDYEVSSWYLCHHPDSRFRSALLAARTTPDRRYGLMNNVLTEHRPDGTSEPRTLTDAAELRRVLVETFGLTLPDAPELDATLARLTGV
jgi:N-hydroxyarylamine O-acetyltransferase